MGSHYIPVGKLKIDKSILDIVCPSAGYDYTPPPPEIYCPANGYYKGLIPTVDENYPPMPTPTDSVAWLLISNNSGLPINLTAGRTNNAEWKADVYGASNNVILSTSSTSTTMSFAVPTSGGTPSNYGLQTFLCKVYVTNGIDFFNLLRTNTGCGSIHVARFNTPKITTGQNMFRYCKDLEVVIFEGGAYNFITRFDYGFYQQKGLISITFPTAMPELTRLDYAFQETDSLETFTLPASLPKLTNMLYLCNKSKGLRNFVVPDAPLLTDVRYAWQDCVNMHTLTFAGAELSELTSSNLAMLSGCISLTKLTLPRMPKVTTLVNLCINLTGLKEIYFPDALPECTTLASCCAGCTNLQKIRMPLSLPKVTTMNNFSNGAKSMNWHEVTWPSEIIIVGGIVENNNRMTSFYQPTLRCGAFSFGTGGGIVESVEIYWPSVTDSFQMWNHKLSKAEIDRILTALPNAGTPGVSYVDFRGNPGTATADWSIITAKGWIVNGL
jgi:hypothetical protein